MTDLERGIQALNLQLANLADDIILKDLKPRWDAIPEFDQKHLYDSDVKLWIACLRKERERLQSLLVQLLQSLHVVQAVPTPPITNKGWSVDELSSDQVMHNLSSLFDILLPESTIPAYVQLNTKVVGNTEVPFFLNQPTLLFWNLGFLNIDDLLSQCLSQRMTIMVGTSGTGKTRDIFEILTQRFGLFFTVHDYVIPGSPDFTNMLQR
ncbi:hypothetical protein HDU79_003839 [Rhizoclosmatium sp. JEL0117]|nr:hypothetical protein HDU79_003839 [Rhizoclosmatium sp. JEL0117]